MKPAREFKRGPHGNRTTKFPPWMCFACGHLCSAASSLLYDVSPSEGDFSVCINCTAVSTLKGGTFVPFYDWGKLDPKERRDITLHQVAIRAMHREIGKPSAPRTGMA